jgi:hypothetical protein
MDSVEQRRERRNLGWDLIRRGLTKAMAEGQTDGGDVGLYVGWIAHVTTADLQSLLLPAQDTLQ